MSNNIIFYGERGLVNGIVLDLKDNLTLLKKFIASIHFRGGKTPVWVNSIEECIYFVEPSFAEFGNPDLMLLCKCENEKHLIFIEAKVSTYEDSSIDINDIKKYIGQFRNNGSKNKSISLTGINSRINTQLSLKYRLASTLKCHVKGEHLIEDDAWRFYYNNYLDFVNHPRRLKKKLNIDMCDEYLTGITDYWFAALTSEPFPVVPYSNMDTRPFVYDKNGNEIWDSVKEHFGIITYQDLDKIFLSNSNYKRAKRYFENKSKGVLATTTASYNISPKNWAKFNTEIKSKLLEDLKQVIEESIEELCIEEGYNKYKSYELQENNGSFSFKKGPMTILSLFPYEESNKQGIMVALRLEYFDESYKKEFPGGPFMFGGGKNRPFIGRFITDIPTEEELQEIQYVIKDYWQSVFN